MRPLHDFWHLVQTLRIGSLEAMDMAPVEEVGVELRCVVELELEILELREFESVSKESLFEKDVCESMESSTMDSLWSIAGGLADEGVRGGVPEATRRRRRCSLCR